MKNGRDCKNREDREREIMEDERNWWLKNMED
jgi:hypothetical protein